MNLMLLWSGGRGFHYYRGGNRLSLRLKGALVSVVACHKLGE